MHIVIRVLNIVNGHTGMLPLLWVTLDGSRDIMDILLKVHVKEEVSRANQILQRRVVWYDLVT